jgi:hypothetical protein
MPGGNASFYERAVGGSWREDVSGKTSTSSLLPLRSWVLR